MEHVDFTKYPEGLTYLAKHLELPVPEDQTSTRERLVWQLIETLIRQ